ncbi:hypothetical protein HC256_005252 [Beauveria bassiana]|nr:hypothetical protein HC256_005252 [Beauveria bassiana]KAH8716487.1 hypothetical protein HC256_005252 [Beauveria bassiana]KAH8716488.1 hypothetical protein HC256_005252 [Beauveria bassiana]
MLWPAIVVSSYEIWTLFIEAMSRDLARTLYCIESRVDSVLGHNCSVEKDCTILQNWNAAEVHPNGQGVHFGAELIPVVAAVDNDANVINQRNSRKGLGAHVVQAHPVKRRVRRLNRQLLNGERRRRKRVGADDPLADEELIIVEVSGSADRFPLGRLIIGNLCGVGQVGPIVPNIQHFRPINTVPNRVVRNVVFQVISVEQKQNAAVPSVLVHKVGCLLLIELGVRVQVAAAVVDTLELAKKLVDHVSSPVDGPKARNVADADEVPNTENDNFAGIFCSELIDFSNNFVESLSRVADGDIGNFIVDVEYPVAILSGVC